MKKLLVSGLLSIIAVSSFGVNASAEEVNTKSVAEIKIEQAVKLDESRGGSQEKANEHGWYSMYGNYYYYEYGNMAKGWRFINGSYYYFDKETGVMFEGEEVLIDGEYYRFANSGAMVVGWYVDTYGEYQLYGANGTKYIKEWYYDGYDWYYIDSWGYMETGYNTIDDNLYYFAENGVMKTGWAYHNYEGHAEYTYHAPNGVAYENQWLYDNGIWYYFDGSNNMCSNENKYINGVWYHFYENGAMA